MSARWLLGDAAERLRQGTGTKDNRNRELQGRVTTKKEPHAFPGSTRYRYSPQVKRGFPGVNKYRT
jgi:hypothetical protein